jgi:hypothetical protein
MFRHYLFLLLVLVFSGCTHIPSLESRLEFASKLTADANWHALQLTSKPFPLTAYVPNELVTGKTLTVYIEGDGLAWISRSRVSDNPTPIHPVALELALQHPDLTVAYLARPCQYLPLTNSNCTQNDWTSGRFSGAAVEASNQAIETLMSRFHATRLVLVGYSGGGAIAALLAAQRDDVIQLVTVAGNLDHAAWTSQHGISPLSDSQNPADYWDKLMSVKQIHFVGSKDSIIGLSTAQSFQAHFPVNQKPEIKVIDGFDHHCCWSQKWPELIPLWQPEEHNKVR